MTGRELTVFVLEEACVGVSWGPLPLFLKSIVHAVCVNNGQHVLYLLIQGLVLLFFFTHLRLQLLILGKVKEAVIQIFLQL